MARLVFIPNWEDGATIPTGKPRNLPFPMPGSFTETLPATADLSYFPIQMTIDEAVKYWWRISKWSAIFTVGSVSDSVVLERSNVTDETRLCLPSNYIWTGTLDLGAGNVFSFTVKFLLPNNEAPESYYCNHTEIVPSVSVVGSLSYFDGDSTLDIQTQAMFDTETESGTLTLDGRSIDWSGISNSSPTGLTLSIIPIE